MQEITYKLSKLASICIIHSNYLSCFWCRNIHLGTCWPFEPIHTSCCQVKPSIFKWFSSNILLDKLCLTLSRLEIFWTNVILTYYISENYFGMFWRRCVRLVLNSISYSNIFGGKCSGHKSYQILRAFLGTTDMNGFKLSKYNKIKPLLNGLISHLTSYKFNSYLNSLWWK